ncbi:MAG: nucleotide exchange factor GrpE [Patescibacteria group bacterium]
MIETNKTSRQSSKQEEEKHPEEIEILKTKMAEYLDGWKRAKADYLNQKKETEAQLKDTVMFANASLIFELLPVMDNFDRAMSHVAKKDKDTDWVKGVVQIQKQLEDILKIEGVERIKTVGEKFNPEVHEAITMEDKKEEESGIISEEMEAGYKLNEKVLRPAKVKVIK